MKFDDIPKEGTKLIIGTRTYIGEDWLHCDINLAPLWDPITKTQKPVDIVADAKSIPLDDKYCDWVFSSECLEHFSHTQYQSVLTEWCRIVKVGGHIRVDVPDMELAMKQWLEWGSIEGDRAMNKIVFGGQFGQNWLWDAHFVGLTPRMLIEDLEGLSFEIEHIKRGSDYGWLSVQGKRLG